MWLIPTLLPAGPQLQDVDVAHLVEQALTQLPPAQLEKVQWQIDLPPALTVRGDSSLLQVVCRNLLDNASKYAPTDSVVRVHAALHPQQLLLHFTNDIPPGTQIDPERLADRFYRSPHHQQIDGAGLGLSIVRQIIRSHQAQLHIQLTATRQVVVTLRFASHFDHHQ